MSSYDFWHNKSSFPKIPSLRFSRLSILYLYTDTIRSYRNWFTEYTHWEPCQRDGYLLCYIRNSSIIDAGIINVYSAGLDEPIGVVRCSANQASDLGDSQFESTGCGFIRWSAWLSRETLSISPQMFLTEIVGMISQRGICRFLICIRLQSGEVELFGVLRAQVSIHGRLRAFWVDFRAD